MVNHFHAGLCLPARVFIRRARWVVVCRHFSSSGASRSRPVAPSTSLAVSDGYVRGESFPRWSVPACPGLHSPSTVGGRLQTFFVIGRQSFARPVAPSTLLAVSDGYVRGESFPRRFVPACSGSWCWRCTVKLNPSFLLSDVA